MQYPIRLIWAHALLCLAMGQVAVGRDVDFPALDADTVQISDVRPAELKQVGPADKDAAPTKEKSAQGKPASRKNPASDLDAAVVSAGQGAFERSCTQCHDAQRALSRQKDLAGWRGTIQRMAAKSGADIPRAEWEAIATYLASRNAVSNTAGNGAKSTIASATAENAGQQSSFSVAATISPVWRGGDDQLEHPGFLPEAWLSAGWQSKGPLSAKVTSCVSCHTEPGQGHRIELVEASMRLDLTQWICGCDSGSSAAVEAGRFVVPFGAFSAQTNPSLYRTVTKPLIYNMGQNVNRFDTGNPVLPMPYADEGVVAHAVAPLVDNLDVSADGYGVNGLQGAASGIDFFQSRDYVDNNSEPAAGGRVTLGNRWMRLGSSITAGRFNNNGGIGPFAAPMNYRIVGIDLTARYKELARFQMEYARRDNDVLVFTPGLMRAREQVAGYYLEGELYISQEPKISLLARYDLQSRDSPLPPPGVVTTGTFNVARWTWGVNFTLPGESLLAINVERWYLPAPLNNVAVLGVRWTATF